jgi:hypothetical protein
VTRPRAADNFPMIRARMEALRHERAQVRAASKRLGMNVGHVSRAQWQDFPRSMDFSIPRPTRPEGFRVKN